MLSPDMLNMFKEIINEQWPLEQETIGKDQACAILKDNSGKEVSDEVYIEFFNDG